MKPLYELHIAASAFRHLLEKDLEVLKKHTDKMLKEEDVSKIRDIARTLDNLWYDLAIYKEWAEKEVEALEKLIEP